MFIYYENILGVKKMKKIIFAIVVISVALIGMSFVSAAPVGGQSSGFVISDPGIHHHPVSPLIPINPFDPVFPVPPFEPISPAEPPVALR